MNHNPYSVMTIPIIHTLCGPITYEATFKGEVVDSKTLLPVAYDSSINTFTIYSEDFALIGTHTITISAKLSTYPFIVTLTPLSTQIQIIDPCIDPQTIYAPSQTNPPSYLYDGTTLAFNLTPYTVFPEVCSIVYSCAIAVSSPRTDLCSIVLDSTAGTFNSITGGYTFRSIDNINFPPGSYTFQITGTSGLKKIMKTWVLTLFSPCSVPGAFTLKTNPFTDKTYILRGPQIDILWSIGDLVSVQTLDNCGSFTVTFFNDGLQTDLDSALFKDYQNVSGNIFSVL